ncbi:unnamed protein product [Bubo scandiacus]
MDINAREPSGRTGAACGPDPNTHWPPTPDPAEPPNISRLKSPARHTVRCADAGVAPRQPLAPRRRGRAGVIQHRAAAAAHPLPSTSPSRSRRGHRRPRRGTRHRGWMNTRQQEEAAPFSSLAARRCRRRGSGCPPTGTRAAQPGYCKVSVNSLGFQPCAVYL